MNREEEPIFRKCCFRIRLQVFLQSWACFKIMADIALIVFLMMFLAIVTRNFRYKMDTHFNEEHVVVMLLVALAVDAIFVVLLSVGLCKKNILSLQVFFYYSIYMAVAGAVFAIGMVFYITPSIDEYGTCVELLIAAVVGGLINTVLDICIILALRSEIIKLQNKALYDFHKMPTFKETSTEQEDEQRLNA